MARALLGEDGRGYELARRLDGCGAWRAWLGDSAYASFAPSLSSPSTWDSFLSSTSPSSLVRLQLRARALLYDKASVALALRHSSSPLPELSALSPSYLQLHGDDVYFSLEDGDVGRDNAKVQSRIASSPSKSNGSYHNKSSSIGSRAIETENEPMQKDKHNDLPDLWYDQFIAQYRTNRHLKFPFVVRDSMKRTPEGMCSYLKLVTMQKRRRTAFKDDKTMSLSNFASENGTLKQQEIMEDDLFVIPELMFPFNCVPDNAILPINETGSLREREVYGVLDSLPHLISPSPAMIERFGIRPEYLRVEFTRSTYRGKSGTEVNRKNLSLDQASQTAKKVVAQVLISTGLDGGSDISIQILSQFLGSHITKLGRVLKLLSDSYRVQFSSTELIKMFLKITGYGNLGALSDYLKSNTRNMSHQVQQGHSPQGQQEAHQLPTHQQQIQRPILSQLNALRPQNIIFQRPQLQIQQQHPLQILQQQQQQMLLQKQQMQMQQQQQLQLQQQQMQMKPQQQQLQQPQQQMQMKQKQQQIQMQQQQMQMQMQQQQQQQMQAQSRQQQMLTHSQQIQSPPQQIQIHQQQQQQMLSQSQQIQSQPQQIQIHQHQMQSQPQQLQLHQQQLQMFQQQQQQLQQQLRQRQMSSAQNPAMALEKERAGLEVKIENMSEHPTDGSFNQVNRQQLQFRNQQLAGSTSHHAQQSKQFKQFPGQSPQLQTQGNFSVRTPPVKVEGFQELMGGGDTAALRLDSEERKLTSSK